MSRKRGRTSHALKVAAVRRVQGGEPISNVADDLSVTAASVRLWSRQEDIAADAASPTDADMKVRPQPRMREWKFPLGNGEVDAAYFRCPMPMTDADARDVLDWMRLIESQIIRAAKLPVGPFQDVLEDEANEFLDGIPEPEAELQP